jgi:hypothetical protein
MICIMQVVGGPGAWGLLPPVRGGSSSWCNCSSSSSNFADRCKRRLNGNGSKGLQL